MDEAVLIEMEHRAECLFAYCRKRLKKLERDDKDIPAGLSRSAEVEEDFERLVAFIRAKGRALAA